MRAVIFILIIIVLALLAGIWSGFLDISQTRPAQAPDVSVNDSGVAASGGQTPAFDVETGTVAVGTRAANVTVPTVRVDPPGSEAGNAVSNTAE